MPIRTKWFVYHQTQGGVTRYIAAQKLAPDDPIKMERLRTVGTLLPRKQGAKRYCEIMNQVNTYLDRMDRLASDAIDADHEDDDAIIGQFCWQAGLAAGALRTLDAAGILTGLARDYYWVQFVCCIHLMAFSREEIRQILLKAGEEGSPE